LPIGIASDFERSLQVQGWLHNDLDPVRPFLWLSRASVAYDSPLRSSRPSATPSRRASSPPLGTRATT
jgi:hypothetical protein